MLLLFNKLSLSFCFVLSELLTQLLLLLPDFVEVKGHITLLADDLRILLRTISTAVLGGRSRGILAPILRLAFCSGVDCLLCGLLQLSEVHLRSFRVLFQDTVIGLLPFVEDVF